MKIECADCGNEVETRTETRLYCDNCANLRRGRALNRYREYTCIDCGKRGIVKATTRKRCNSCRDRNMVIVTANNRKCYRNFSAIRATGEFSRHRAINYGAWIYPIPAGNRRELFADSGGFCVVPGCWRTATHVDHVKALNDGGLHLMSNMQGMCGSHNAAKRDKYIDYRTEDSARKWWQYDYMRVGRAVSAAGYLYA